jgi:hypothetical protein
MRRPQRVSFCCVRRRNVNHPRKDFSPLEVFLTSRAGLVSGTFPVQATRRVAPQRPCQIGRMPCSSATRLRKRPSRSRSIIESFTWRCTPLQTIGVRIKLPLFCSKIHSTARTDSCIPRKSFSSHWMQIWLSCRRAIPLSGQWRGKRGSPRWLVLSSWPEVAPSYPRSGPLTTTALCI